MELLREEEADALGSLEERIRKAVDLVAALRKEKAVLEDRLAATVSEKEVAMEKAAAAADQALAVAKELESLRVERKQVRARIEKLLGQMDLLSNA